MPNWVPDNKFSYPPACKVWRVRENARRKGIEGFGEGDTFRLLLGSDKNASFNEFFMQPVQFVGSLGSPPEATVLYLSLSHCLSLLVPVH